MTDSPLEQPAPYGGPATTPARGSSNPADDEGSTPGRSPRRVRTHHLRQWKTSGERFAMLTCYDALTAQLFDSAGIDVLLVGDSAANTVHGHRTSLPVTTDELLPLARAVASHAERALVMGDLPFGSYQASPEQAYATAARFMKEAGVAAIKLEGGATMAPQIERLSRGGIPVCAHIGFTPQYEHALGGYRVQGRGDAAARVLADARAVQDAGAFAVLLEMVPTEVAAQVTRSVDIPTIGIGAGPVTDGQVLVWQDALGLTTGRLPRFVKQFADLRTVMTDAARAYAAEVRDGTFPASEHTF